LREKKEIADAVELPQRTIADKIEVLSQIENLPNVIKLSINYQAQKREIQRYCRASNTETFNRALKNLKEAGNVEQYKSEKRVMLCLVYR